MPLKLLLPPRSYIVTWKPLYLEYLVMATIRIFQDEQNVLFNKQNIDNETYLCSTLEKPTVGATLSKLCRIASNLLRMVRWYVLKARIKN